METHEHGNGLPGMDMTGMKMYFHIGFDDYILFKQYVPKADWEMVLTCVVIFLVAIGYEGFKVCRQRHLKSILSEMGEDEESRCLFWKRRTKRGHIIQSVLHIVQVGFGYILMLLAMTYNVWIFVSIILGAGVGYFLFSVNTRPNSMVIEDHCN